MLIPDTIGSLDMRGAFLFYRDALKLHVYPVDGPWSKKPDPGKKPSVCGWWNYDPHDCDVRRFFDNNGRCHNIGFAPKNRVVAVDLDDKPHKGEGVRRFLAEHPDCTRGPYHETNGGAHLVFLCPDLPPLVEPDGKPCRKPLPARPRDGVEAALYHSDHTNVVLPPSVHIQGTVYRWKAFGEIPEVSWQWLLDTFGFSVPENEHKDRSKKKKKETPWQLKFKGDLRSLDLCALLETLGFPAELIDADDNKYSLLCPWHEEHGTPGKTGSSTVVWQRPDTWPQFKCLHAHCSERTLQHLLEWTEAKEPGVVDRFCKRARVYEPGQQDEERPRVLHPNDRLDSEVHTELGSIIRPKYTWFKRAGRIVTIDEVPSGFVYSNNPETEYTIETHTTGFRELDPREARSRLEEYAVPGILVKDELGNPEFIKKSFSSDFCTGLVHSVHLRRKLHDILRVLTVPIPIRVGGKLAYPRPGYDARFGTFLVDGAPTIKEMPLEKALRILQKIHAEFCFTNDGKEQSGQSRTHAIARLLTPFARGILGWTTRVPLWFYFANRPRAGKDYLAAIPLLVYQGHAFEDLPIGKDSEETAKRIVAAARNGRHFMHFSNCQGYLGDQYFCQIITATGIGGRSLGANAAASDLLLPNEMEFSLSANVGLSYHEDFEPRMRKIELAYYGQDPNARVFQNKFLHQDIKEHRGDTLSAIAAVFRNWEKKGFPNGATPFISFPQWAEVVGGVMTATKDLGDHALGDPCLPFKGEYDDVGGDRLTEAMTQLFRVCRAEFGDRKVFKKDIYKCVHEAAMNEEGGNDALAYFGDLEDSEDARKNQTRLGINLTKFKNRELSGITLLVDASLANSVKHTYRFFEALAREPVNLCEPLAELRVTRETSDELKSVPRVEQKNENDLHAHNLKSPPEVHAGSQVHGSEDPPADLSSPTLAVDIETYTEIRTDKNGKILRSKDALNAQKGEIRLLSIADASGGISLRDLRESPISPEEREIIESRDELILHNAGFDLRFLGAKLGIFPQRVFDTFTAAWLLSPRKERIHDLGSVLERHLEIKIPKGQGASDWGGMLLTDEQIAYAKDDVRFLHRLKDRLVKELEAMKLGAVFEMESRLLPIIAGMETRGFAVDTDRMRKLKEAADHNAGTLAAALRKDFGAEGLNPASPQELLEAFKKDGIELEDTSEETLCALEDPRAQTILRWRAETKLSSNCKTLLGAEHQGRIYARFDPLGTVTGRFSSKSPNLQNVTRGPLRSCFIPSGPDRRLIVADYSQIELRVAALIAKETVMIDAFKTKADLHKMTAAAVLRKPVGEVAKDDRQMAKAVSFGFLYGQSANGFVAYARANYGLNLSLEDAERFRENFFFTYPAFRRWHIACKRKAVNSDNGSARTVFGRLLMARKDDAWARFNMFTEYVVSGSCADLLKMAMIKVAAVVPADVHPVATIHDELVYDAPADTAKQYCSVIRQAMEDAFTEMFGKVVPVEVEAKVCGNWGEK